MIGYRSIFAALVGVCLAASIASAETVGVHLDRSADSLPAASPLREALPSEGALAPDEADAATLVPLAQAAADPGLPRSSEAEKAGSAASVDRRIVKDAPRLPSSLALFLSAVGPLGAWHVLRSLRKLHLGHLPEWYHGEGPVQIGHVTLLDLTPDSLPVIPNGSPPLLDALRPSIPPDKPIPPRASRQFVLPVTGPRAPPVLR